MEENNQSASMPDEHYQNQGEEYSTKLGDILLNAGLITEEQLSSALGLQKETSMKLGEILVSYQWITEDALVGALSRQFGYTFLEYIDVNRIEPTLKNLIPERIIKEYLIFPIQRAGNTLKIVMSDPTNLSILDDVRAITGFTKIEILLATPTLLKNAINELYESEMNMNTLLGEIDEDDVEIIEEEEETVNAAELRAQVEDTPIIRMVNLIIKEALKAKATDIHLEPYEHTFRIRYRIDGILYEVPTPPKKYQGSIISRVKIMADLDIAERRLPQDGRFKLRLANKEIDFRISTMPTVFGEKVVLRILDKSDRMQNKTGTVEDLERLGMSKEQTEIIKRSIFRPHGMILVTGPTGSGKTTTLYTCLEILNKIDRNIMTVEDPVEYMIPGINQVATRPQIGLNFAAVLRSILRQDPNIIMVGEIRDKETAEIAINAALTGHLVFSTLHTNDSPGAIVRLDNMGVEPFLVTSTLLLVIAQRLMRRICPSCYEQYHPDPELLSSMGLSGKLEDVVLYRGKGCEECSGTGYRGRVGVYEILELTEEVKKMILCRASSTEIKAALRDKGFKTLRSSSLESAINGYTTLEEVWRVSTEDFLTGE